MKKYLLIIIAVLFAIPSFAQKQDKDKENRRKEMLEFKIDYLSKEIDLKEDQKKQFSELYAQMESERRAILKRIKKAEKSIKENKDASEADYDKANKEIAAAKSEMIQIEKKYEDKFGTFLSKKQMFRLKEAERNFSMKMQDCKDKRKQGKREKN